jgi:hypothetical protein
LADVAGLPDVADLSDVAAVRLATGARFAALRVGFVAAGSAADALAARLAAGFSAGSLTSFSAGVGAPGFFADLRLPVEVPAEEPVDVPAALLVARFAAATVRSARSRAVLRAIRARPLRTRSTSGPCDP